MDWRLIETAPRDGVTIFGENVNLGQRGMVHWNGWEWEIVDGLDNMPMGIGFCPTHWMPLPPAAIAALSAIPMPATGEVERALVRCSTAMNAFIYKIGLDDAGNYYWTDPPLRAEAQEAMAANNEAFAALTDHTTKDDE